MEKYFPQKAVLFDTLGVIIFQAMVYLLILEIFDIFNIFREIQAARTIQLAWRKYYASILEERMKVKYNH